VFGGTTGVVGRLDVDSGNPFAMRGGIVDDESPGHVPEERTRRARRGAPVGNDDASMMRNRYPWEKVLTETER
jgi:hypothetical protein